MIPMLALLAVFGGMIYAFDANAKRAELGRILFFVAVLWTTQSMKGSVGMAESLVVALLVAVLLLISFYANRRGSS